MPPSLAPPRCAPDTSPHRLSAALGEKRNRIAGAGVPRQTFLVTAPARTGQRPGAAITSVSGTLRPLVMFSKR